MRTPRLLLAAIALALIAAACSADAGGGPAEPADPPATTAPDAPSPFPTTPAPDRRYATVTAIIEYGDVPVACVGGVAASLPPQCGGLDLIGFEWADVAFQEASGVRFTNATYLEGRFIDADQFEVAMARDATDADRPTGREFDFSSPCDPPEGGWAVVDASLVDENAIGRVQAYMDGTGDLSALWVTQPPSEVEVMDPANTILNVAVLANAEQHEAAIRELYGGPLCVVVRSTSADRLRAIQDDLTDEMQALGFHYIGADELNGVVSVGVLVLDPVLEAELADRFGAGVIVYEAQFWPVDD